jgi:hypothetical protein
MYYYLLLKFYRFSVDKNIHFILAVFFNHERPEDIGISGALKLTFLPAQNSTRSSAYASYENSNLTISHLTLEASIELVKHYTDSLYKNNYPREVSGPDTASIAEYTSIPLWIKLSDSTVIRAGQDVKLFGLFSPITSIFSPVSSISNIQNTKYLTSYDITSDRKLSTKDG